MSPGESSASAYCGACGAELSSSARFCRSCGAAQRLFIEVSDQPDPAAPSDSEAPTRVQAQPPATPPPPPPPPALPPLPPPPPTAPAPPAARGSATLTAGAFLAILGGVGMIAMVLEATVYYPLHNHYSLNFGESPQFGDLLAFGSGLVAIVIGALALSRPPARPLSSGVWLVAAGIPTLVLTVVWDFPNTFHLTYYPRPFYAGFVYFADIGSAHIGSGLLQVPLVVSCVIVILAGILIAIEPGRTPPAPTWTPAPPTWR